MREENFPGELSKHFVPVRPDWLAGAEAEEIIDPELPIVDAHHHLFDFPTFHYLMPDMLADMDCGHDIAATLFVECRTMYRPDGPTALRSLGETEFANGVAAMSASGRYGDARLCARIIGNVDLCLGAAAQAALEAHIAVSGGRFCGIRNVAAWHEGDEIKATSANPPPGLLLDPAFRQGFACLAPLDLSFDAWILHTQLGDLIDLARAFPDTRIVLDHLGGAIGIGPYAGRRDEVFAQWHAQIRELAKCPNVRIKLGGLAMHVFGFDFHKLERPPVSVVMAEAWRPYVAAAIEAFGVRRCMFESNFPVDKGMCTYQALWNAFKHLASGCSAAEKSALFSGTACETYGLTPPE